MTSTDTQFTYEVPPEIASPSGQMNPYPFFAKMRRTSPIRYDEERESYDCYLYEDVVDLMSDHERFTRVGTSFFPNSMAGSAPPEHTKIRGMAEEYFTPGAVNEHRPEFETLAEELLDEALAGSDHIDFVADIAKPFPITIIARLLGVPPGQMDTFREWSLALAEAPTEFTSEAIQKNYQRRVTVTDEMEEFFEDLLEEREQNPQDDLMTKFLKAEDQVDMLTRDHTIATCNQLLLAGNITTTTLLTNAVWTFDEEGIVDAFREDTLSLQPAIEEVLRYRSPVMRVKRNVTMDTKLGGQQLTEGDRVLGWISSAHRDEERFNAPDEFRPDRSPSSQPVAFGKGIHFCLGAPLARLEAEIMLDQFFDRIEDLSIVDTELDPFFSAEIFGPMELPLSVST